MVAGPSASIGRNRSVFRGTSPRFPPQRPRHLPAGDPPKVS